MTDHYSARASGGTLGRELYAAAEGAPDRLGALVEAYVRPFVREVAANSPSYWARFNDQ